MQAQTLPDLVNKQECTVFVLLITVYFIVLYQTGQNRSGFKVFKLKKCITLSLFEAAMQNQCWLLLAGALLSQK